MGVSDPQEAADTWVTSIIETIKQKVGRFRSLRIFTPDKDLFQAKEERATKEQKRDESINKHG